MTERNGGRINAMRIKWIGPMLFAAAVALGACAPTQQGADETEEATATASPTVEAAADTPEPAGTPKPAETPYDY